MPWWETAVTTVERAQLTTQDTPQVTRALAHLCSSANRSVPGARYHA